MDSDGFPMTGCEPLSLLTVRGALEEGTRLLGSVGIESARLDAEILLGLALGKERAALYSDYGRPLEAHARDLFQRVLERRARREPVPYITGRREFWSLDFFVAPEVLIPRPETERAVEIALELMPRGAKDLPFRVLDVGTGSGVIAISLAKEREDAEVWATDLSPAALKVPRTNALRHGVERRFHLLQGDAFEPVKNLRGFFSMIVSNPPYIRSRDFPNLPPEARDWEPRLALDGGLDGLSFYRRLAQEGHLYLGDEGFMVLELGSGMAEEVSSLFERVGRYSTGSVHRDYAGRERVLAVQKLG